MAPQQFRIKRIRPIDLKALPVIGMHILIDGFDMTKYAAFSFDDHSFHLPLTPNACLFGENRGSRSFQ